MVKWISFGDGAGHLMEGLLKNAGVGEVGPGTVLVQPEADSAVLDLLREAAAGGWIVELLDREDVPDTGQGLTMRLREVHVDNGPVILAGGDQDDHGNWVRVGLHTVERVHIF